MISTNFIVKFIKFGVVGFSGVFVDFGTTYFFKEIIKINKFLANSIGFTLAASSNYVLNRIWTFESTNQEITKQYIMFLLISLVGLAINNIVIYILNGKLRINNFYFAKLIATLIVMLWNFFMNMHFTFA